MFDKLPVSSKTEKILTKSLDEQITVEEANHLMKIQGSDLFHLRSVAGAGNRSGKIHAFYTVARSRTHFAFVASFKLHTVRRVIPDDAI